MTICTGCCPCISGSDSRLSKRTLTNTIKLCEKLGNPQERFKSVHIAGTNGKGSSAHMLASILQAAGYKVGLYTSPHLKKFTERIRINGVETTEDFVCDFVAKMKMTIETIQPSFFELTVAMAFEYFADEHVDVAVVEVGLGGRFDSTNIITPEVSLITSISYDHMDMLGNTLAEIAFEKAGIIKKGVPVIISEYHGDTVHVFKQKARDNQSPLYFADDFYQCVQQQTNGVMATYDVKSLKNQEFPNTLDIDLTGKYQEKNIPGVLLTVDLLRDKNYRITREQVSQGLRQVKGSTGLKGRWQILGQQPLIICDTGHNEDGVRLVTTQLKSMSYRRLYIILGMVKDKELDKIFIHLPKEAKYYFCEANIPRALEAEILQKEAKKFGLESQVIRDVNEAVSVVLQEAGKEDIIFIGGSNFIVAELESI